MTHTLRSAVEDLRDNTLTRLSNVLARFAFVCARRRAKEQYIHWGLARTHGAEETQRAFSETHSHVFMELLQTSVRELWRLVRQRDSNVSQIRDLQEKQPKKLIPEDVKGGSVWHLRATLKTLIALDKAAGQSDSHIGQVRDGSGGEPPLNSPHER